MIANLRTLYADNSPILVDVTTEINVSISTHLTHLVLILAIRSQSTGDSRPAKVVLLGSDVTRGTIVDVNLILHSMLA